MQRFEGKTVLVTGGSSGIGLATAEAYANEGAQVIITGRDEVALAEAAASIGKNVVAIKADSQSLADAKALGQAISARQLRLDAVFINAGIAKFAGLSDVTEEFFDSAFGINVKGPFFQIQAIAPLLNRGASIVLNGSINAHIGMPNTAIYAASKAALVSLAKTLSAELLPHGVRVNVVSPGPVATPLYGKLGMDSDTLTAVAEQIRGQIPLGRFGTPEELASTVLHLSAPESAFIVGTEIIVDGGMSQL
jgi:NAD(P)-dependent dehydrogenase (short-subunit alcohol dehydrogenase family)